MVSEIFGEKVFNLITMKQKLPKDVYKKMEKIIKEGAPFDPSIADTVANAMKTWAIDLGCTHYTHLFQPLTVTLTAEKHDSFIDPELDGGMIEKFTGKELMAGEPDGSSFPTGGIRETCASRGYTAWDPTSYAYVKENSLYIPTAFFSYTGEALDRKTPLLRSQEAVSTQAKRVLAHFGKSPARVLSYVGPEQEYFIVDAKEYAQRKDLRLTGRTLFGAPPAKGQELDDHYFGALKARIADFMDDLDKELWEYGIQATTKHNEVAPSQHEVAPVFSTSVISTDTNLQTMEILKKIAKKHNLECLLHEKPFEGVNGSGKHNNWSLGTSDGENLLKPHDLENNKQFYLILAAVIKAVDDYADVLRASAASAGNDHRLGANEAPPAIVTMYLGAQLDNVVDAIANGRPVEPLPDEPLITGVSTLPTLKKDASDRNRTSPFAFTGNRFEFRMPGSNQSIADINTVINTIVAQSFREIADALDEGRSCEEIAQKLMKEHRRVIFNGNGYSRDWPAEAEKRGLANNKNTPSALSALVNEKNVKLFSENGVFTEKELHARYLVGLEEYSKLRNIEANCCISMAEEEILPACLSYTKSVIDDITAKKNIGIEAPVETEKANKLNSLTEALMKETSKLKEVLSEVPADTVENAHYFADSVLPQMNEVRKVADELEVNVAKSYWPFPTYDDLLFNV